MPSPPSKHGAPREVTLSVTVSLADLLEAERYVGMCRAMGNWHDEHPLDALLKAVGEAAKVSLSPPKKRRKVKR